MTDITWFRQPARDGSLPGTLNPVFQLLDHPVISGRSDAPVLVDDGTVVSHAVLLEEVAALGGVLRGLGVEPGTPVGVRLPADRRGATALLALARLGGVLVDEDEEADGLVVSEEGVGDVDWSLVRELGRTDPAPAAELPADAPWTAHRSVADLAHALRVAPTPLAPADLVRALRG